MSRCLVLQQLLPGALHCGGKHSRPDKLRLGWHVCQQLLDSNNAVSRVWVAAAPLFQVITGDEHFDT